MRNTRILQNQFHRPTPYDKSFACQREYNCSQLPQYHRLLYLINIKQLCEHIASVAKHETCRSPASMRFGERAAKPASCQRRQSVFRHASPFTQYTDRHRIKILKIVTQGTRCPVSDFQARSISCPCQSRSSFLIIEAICESPRHRSRTQRFLRASNSWILVAYRFAYCSSSSKSFDRH